MYVQAKDGDSDMFFVETDDMGDQMFVASLVTDALWPKTGESYCPSESHDGQWVCTRAKGHAGIHMAGTGPNWFVAYWNDDHDYVALAALKRKLMASSADNFFDDLGL